MDRETLQAPLRWLREGLFTAPGRRFVVFLLCLGGLFSLTLARWLVYAWSNEEASHTLLIPWVTLYLLSTASGPARQPVTSVAAGVLWALSGLGCVLMGVFSPALPLETSNLKLAWQLAGLVCLLQSGVCVFFGWAVYRQHLFALLFLFCAVPVPTPWLDHFAITLQHWSADAAEFFFRLGGMTMLRSGQTFQLPGITLEVAEECSGVRSTLVLLIVGLLLSKLLFRSGWRRALLVSLVIPIGIIRNGFRVFTLGMLTVHVDPALIHSWIHHRGGPLFFAASLVPLFLVAWWLARTESRARATAQAPDPQP